MKEEPKHGDTVLELIVIPTEVDGKVKVRIGIRGDKDDRIVDTKTELPGQHIRLLALISLLEKKTYGH